LHTPLSREVEGNGPVKPGNPPGASGARPEKVPIPPMRLCASEDEERSI
jgi:hypothetical protein